MICAVIQEGGYINTYLLIISPKSTKLECSSSTFRPIKSDGMENSSLYQEHRIQQKPLYYSENQSLVPRQQPLIVMGPLRVAEKNSFATTCPNCRNQILTRVERKIGIGNWILCIGCLIAGCDAGCCLIPFCMGSVKDVDHKCPYCNSTVGVSPIV
jgi:lipopolysaccharide-induced tumor necrosis factor-alpha factor